jgi:hypothetical protein
MEFNIMAQQHKVTGVATSIRTDPDGTHVRYHDTDVVSFSYVKSLITLRTGGWRTVTTKTRMNQAANQFNLGFQVAQKDGDWTVHLPGRKDIPFDSDTITFTMRQ